MLDTKLLLLELFVMFSDFVEVPRDSTDLLDFSRPKVCSAMTLLYESKKVGKTSVFVL